MPAFLYIRIALVGLLSAITALPALAQVRTRPVTFPQATAATAQQSATLTDIVFGEEAIDFTVTAKAGNVLSVNLASKNTQAYFNVLPPGSEEAIFIGSTSGTSFSGVVDKDGSYIVRAYLMRAAGRRNETADIKLTITLGAKAPTPAAAAPNAGATPAAATPPAAFDRTEQLHGISFRVTSPNSAGKNTVTVLPSGLAVVNEAETVEIDGIVTSAEAGDIDADGSPEIYVYVRGRSGGAPGTLVAFSTNKKKSMSPIRVPDLASKDAEGYRGGDEFAVVENSVARRFKLHGASGPTGKMRQLQYKLHKGEASWVLKVHRRDEF